MTKSGAIALNIVIPAHNEGRIIVENTERTIKYLDKYWRNKYCLTIVDSGSTDNTGLKAQQLAHDYPQVKFLSLKRKGRGLAIRLAWQKTPASVVAYMDADLATGLRNLPRLLKPLINKEADLVVGSRLVRRAEVKRGWFRKTVSILYSRLVQLTLRTPIKDYQCGFKAMRGNLVYDLLKKVEDNNWVFDTELIICALDAGLKVKEIPVSWQESPSSSVRVFPTAVSFLIGLNRIARARKNSITPERIGVLIMLLMASLTFGYGITNNSWANTYYSMAAQAASVNWQAFFFGSLDQLGFVTIDKLPMTIWPSAISIKIFGLNSFAVLIPHIVAGIISTYLLYKIIRRDFGIIAGLLSGLLFCLTPVVVVIFRYNNPDSFLVLSLLAATGLFLQALRDKSTKYLIGAYVLLGVGFGFKMFQVLPVLVIFTVVYCFRSRIKTPRRWIVLAYGILSFLLTALWWPLVMSIISAKNRPFIGSTQSNSIWELILKYSGISRLDGNMNIPPVSSVGTAFGGNSGWGRLLSEGFAQSIMWLVPLAVVIGIAGIWLYRRNRESLNQLIVWLPWLIVYILLISFAKGIVHPYYTVVMAPAIAALCAVGIATTVHQIVNSKVNAFTKLIIAILLVNGVIFITMIAQGNVLIADWLWQLSIIIGILGVLAMIWYAFSKIPRSIGFALGLGLIANLVLPIGITVQTVFSKQAGFIPTPAPIPKQYQRITNPALAFPIELSNKMVKNYQPDTWLAATQNSFDAAPIQLATGKPVMVLGGFNGEDNIISLKRFKELVKLGKVNYFVINSRQTATSPACPLAPDQILRPDMPQMRPETRYNRNLPPNLRSPNPSINSICPGQLSEDIPSTKTVAAWAQSSGQLVGTNKEGWRVYRLTPQ